jgi:hypothetical protein
MAQSMVQVKPGEKAACLGWEEKNVSIFLNFSTVENSLCFQSRFILTSSWGAILRECWAERRQKQL